jgi:predicted RNA binding protein with dsRBD fold (UPF0201 family)
VEVVLGRSMQEPMLRLNGVNESLQIRIETALRGADIPQRVELAVLTLFPEFPVPKHLQSPQLGQASDTVWTAENVSLATFLKLMHEQRILDTALDAMTVSFEGSKTQFSLLRQAAIVGKVAFPLPGESPLGGLINVYLEGQNLGDWLEAATWHKGRDTVPRSIQDDNTMGLDGEAVTWI